MFQTYSRALSVLAVLLCSGHAWGQRASAVFMDAPSSQVIAGDTAQISIAAFDSNGTSIPSATFTWSVSDSSAFSVDSSGTVHAKGLGWADIYADTNGARGTLRLQSVPLAINVHPANKTIHAGDTLQYSADALDVNSQPLPGAILQWRAYGANSGTNNGIAIDAGAVAHTSGYGTFFIEAFFNYTTGTGPFIPRVVGNTLLTVLPPVSFTQTKLLDSTPVRQTFQLRERRGQLSVNDNGQIAYVGWLEGFATAALLWNSGSFTPILAGGTPAELPGSNLVDMDDLALNNNGEVSTRCVVVPYRGCMMFAGQDNIPHLILFDGAAGANAANVRNFNTTRFGLNDSSVTLFRADYYDVGSTVLKTGLFTVQPSGNLTLVVAAATNLPGLGGTYSFDRDFGIANDGTILFFATNGASRALYRMTADSTISRVIGTGDLIDGAPITSLGSVAVGKNGHYAVEAFNGSQNIFLFNGDPANRSRLAITNYNSVYAVSGAGEAVFWCSVNNAYGLFRWNGGAAVPVILIGTPSPSGDLITQFDSAGITARGEVIVQARTTNNLLLAINAGTGTGAHPAVVFQTGAPVNIAAGTAFYNFVLNSHTGNPMIKTGWYSGDIFELSSGFLIPRLINGDRTPGGWFYEGNLDTRRTGDGDLIVSTDQTLSRVSAGSASVMVHLPQISNGGNLYSGFQVAANSQGLAAMVGGNSFGIQDLAIVSGGTANVIAWLGTSGNKTTLSPGGGSFAGSNDIAVAEDGTVYAALRVNGGPNGLFAWDGSAWKTVLLIGDPFDGRAVTNIGNIRVAGTACFALITTTSNLVHLSVFQNGSWRDAVSQGDAIPAGGVVGGIGAFDANRNGSVAVNLYGTGGIQYIAYVNSGGMRVAANNNYPLTTGEMMVNYFQVSLNDDNRIFVSGITSQDLLVIYEFDPLF